jgi:hypothetical protein
VHWDGAPLALVLLTVNGALLLLLLLLLPPATTTMSVVHLTTYNSAT